MNFKRGDDPHKAMDVGANSTDNIEQKCNILDKEIEELNIKRSNLGTNRSDLRKQIRELQHQLDDMDDLDKSISKTIDTRITKKALIQAGLAEVEMDDQYYRRNNVSIMRVSAIKDKPGKFEVTVLTDDDSAGTHTCRSERKGLNATVGMIGECIEPATKHEFFSMAECISKTARLKKPSVPGKGTQKSRNSDKLWESAAAQVYGGITTNKNWKDYLDDDNLANLNF